MRGYFIKYGNRIIIVEENDNTLNRTYKCYLLPIREDVSQYEIVRMRHPFSGLIKIDLHEQLYGKNLQRYLPKKVMNIVLSLPEVKVILRDEKINRILNE